MKKQKNQTTVDFKKETPTVFRVKNGKFQEKSTVVYTVRIPDVKNEKTRFYLERLQEAYLRFLQKESQKANEELRFGGLNFLCAEEKILLLRAFGPYSQRNFERKAVLFLNNDGSLKQIRFF